MDNKNINEHFLAILKEVYNTAETAAVPNRVANENAAELAKIKKIETSKKTHMACNDLLINGFVANILQDKLTNVLSELPVNYTKEEKDAILDKPQHWYFCISAHSKFDITDKETIKFSKQDKEQTFDKIHIFLDSFDAINLLGRVLYAVREKYSFGETLTKNKWDVFNYNKFNSDFQLTFDFFKSINEIVEIITSMFERLEQYDPQTFEAESILSTSEKYIRK